MKSFLYTYKEHKRGANGYAAKTIKLWSVKDNQPKFLGRYTATCESEGQQLMNTVKKLEALPSEYSECSSFDLEQKGIATFWKITEQP